jgi:hypothetical protein
MLAGVGRACLLMSAGGLLALAGISTSRANVAILDQPVAEAPGQGHGNMAVRGKWVMLVWPDIRNGAHVRYSLLHDPGAEGVGNGGRR